MLATMICSKCGEPRYVSNREVTLPYVCLSCSIAEAEPTEPTEEFATVENTTLLIADLEEQLAEAMACNARQAGVIEDQRGYIERREDEITTMRAQADEQEAILTAIKVLLRTR